MKLSSIFSPVFDFPRFRLGIREYIRYWRSWRKYAKLKGAEPMRIADAWPCIYDRTQTTDFGGQYFYQNIWAFNLIKQKLPPEHVDVGSLASVVGLMTTITRVTFIDIRPLDVILDNFSCRVGSILSIPYPDGSIPSLSCLHVAEHIGLGRYGDPLDPLGTQKALGELARVLSPGGDFYLGIPIGKARVCFNAHRILDPLSILEYCGDLELVGFAAIDDAGFYHPAARPEDFRQASYSCGLYHFTRPL